MASRFVASVEMTPLVVIGRRGGYRRRRERAPRFPYNRCRRRVDSLQEGRLLHQNLSFHNSMSLTYQPFSEMPEVETVDRADRPARRQNVGHEERNWSLIGGAALVAASLAGRGLARILGTLAGGALVYRGVTGHCHMYEALGISTSEEDQAGVPDNTGHKVVRSIVIQRPREELYRHWRNLENLAGLMSHVKSVEVLDEKTSHWVVTGPAGTSLEWDAEIINERENALIAWQSLPGAQVPNAGSVWFEDAPGGGTRLKVALEVAAPGGELGVMVAGLFRESPEQQLDDDLQRFKEEMEPRSPVPAGNGVSSPS